jgi:hypothetical protein
VGGEIGFAQDTVATPGAESDRWLLHGGVAGALGVVDGD